MRGFVVRARGLGYTTIQRQLERAFDVLCHLHGEIGSATSTVRDLERATANRVVAMRCSLFQPARLPIVPTSIELPEPSFMVLESSLHVDSAVEFLPIAPIVTLNILRHYIRIRGMSLLL